MNHAIAVTCPICDAVRGESCMSMSATARRAYNRVNATRSISFDRFKLKLPHKERQELANSTPNDPDAGPIVIAYRSLLLWYRKPDGSYLAQHPTGVYSAEVRRAPTTYRDGPGWYVYPSANHRYACRYRRESLREVKESLAEEWGCGFPGDDHDRKVGRAARRRLRARQVSP